jgi:hypothetical protein
MGLGMENPDLPPPGIYHRLFHVPKGGGKLGFYCIQSAIGCLNGPLVFLKFVEKFLQVYS